MEILKTIIIFFAEALIIVLAIVAVLVAVAALIAKAKGQKSFEIELLHEKYQDQTQALKEALLSDDERKAERKKVKARNKLKAKFHESDKLFKPRIFVIDFLKGDLKASAAEHLREEISTILGVATTQDEVVVNIESPGGLVHGYGFAAAQLLRLRQMNIPLTVCVDQIAASGGYLMACTANKILASPFALIGSIGVVAQVPNFNRLLKKHDVDFKEYTAGEYKRTISLFGEITEKGENKFKEQLEQTHDMFKDFVAKYRPQLDIKAVATGEYWYGEMALKNGLVDEIKTSDEYLLHKSIEHQIVRVSFETKPSLSDKLTEVLSKALMQVVSKLMAQNSSVKNV
jgi:serine protease SohB